MEPINDKLNQQLKEQQLLVPEGYFEQLEQDIFKATTGVKQIEITARKQPTLIKRLIIVTAVAASIALVYIGVNLFSKDKITRLGVQFAEMTDAEINNYMDEQIASLSYDDLYGYLNTNVDDLSTDVLFASTYSDAGQIDESITGELHEQVLDQDVMNSVIDQSPIMLDETIMDSIDNELLQEYFNDATLFENLGL
ncbi:MAG TPA: hypothetical protein PLB46_10175 [Chitinophagales bacterium]|nr:hypothetical protein [Chitinophagales bacterium]